MYISHLSGALRVFSKHGAQVDTESQIVRLPPEMVFEAMSQARRVYTLSGRVEGTNLVLDGSASYFSTDGSGTETIDFVTGEYRQSTKADVAMMARAADYLYIDLFLLAYGQCAGLWATGPTA